MVLADDLRIRSETARPERVTEHHHVPSAHRIVAGRDGASQSGVAPRTVKNPPVTSPRRTTSAAPCPVSANESLSIGGDLGEDGVVAAPVGEVRRRHRAADAIGLLDVVL